MSRSLRSQPRHLTSLLVLASVLAVPLAALSSAQAQPFDPAQKSVQRPLQPKPAPQPLARPTPQPQPRVVAPQRPIIARPATPTPDRPRYEPPRREVRGTGERRIESGERRIESGERRIETGERRWQGGERRRDYRPGIAAGVAAVIIGSTLGYRYYRGPDRESLYDRCDRNFPDFDYDTGTFINDDGDRQLCPYLAPYVD